MRSSFPSIVAAAIAGAMPTSAIARNPFEFQTPVTPVGEETLHVHNLFLTIVVVVYGLGLLFLLYTVFRHRKSAGHAAVPFSAPTSFFQWGLFTLPFIALVYADFVIMGVPAYHAVVAMADTRHDAGLVVKITGHQWKWEYEYPDQGIDFTSNLATPREQIEGTAPPDPNYLLEVDNPLVLPVGVKVRILLTSTDVIHSWWVPAFGVKQDAVPGFLRESWVKIEKPGIYRGQCGELCGVGHAFMPIVVKAESQAEFVRWAAETHETEMSVAAASSQAMSFGQLMARGKADYESDCAGCHQPTGVGIAGAVPPIAGGQAFAATPNLTNPLAKLGYYRDGKIVVGTLSQHLNIVLNGISGTSMVAWGAQLNDADIAAIITYERNSFGNHTGDTVQPADVKAARAHHQ